MAAASHEESWRKRQSISKASAIIVAASWQHHGNIISIGISA